MGQMHKKLEKERKELKHVELETEFLYIQWQWGV